MARLVGIVFACLVAFGCVQEMTPSPETPDAGGAAIDGGVMAGQDAAPATPDAQPPPLDGAPALDDAGVDAGDAGDAGDVDAGDAGDVDAGDAGDVDAGDAGSDFDAGDAASPDASPPDATTT